nr:MAG TPA: hypothetical protein [Caudoviricetes sp.]
MIQRWKNPVGDRIPMGFLFLSSILLSLHLSGVGLFVHR